MPQYVALLRGINVGGHRVKMDHLRRLFEELGYLEVTTFIASGNVVFSSDLLAVDALQSEIEAHLAQELGYEVATFIRTPGELAAIAAFVPTQTVVTESSSIYVVLTRDVVPPGVRSKIAALGSASDAFEFVGREIYWIMPGKLSDSPLFDGGIGKVLRGPDTTTRNVTTVRRLSAKLEVR